MESAHLFDIRPRKTLIGPSKVISSRFWKCNGPILGHRKCLLEKQWVQVTPSAAAFNNAMGLFLHIRSTSQSINGPKQSTRQQGAANTMGPSMGIGSTP